jgi:endonuclease/exonuclease/phosphatase family metal-dependent hydrolase
MLVAASCFAVLGLVTLTLTVFPELQAQHQWLALAASFGPYGWFAWLGATVLTLAGARGRLRLLAAPLALGLAWHIGVLTPYLQTADTVAATPANTLRILELNLRFGLADLDQLSAEVSAANVDVVVLEEVTRSNAKTFAGKAWRKLLPYQLGTAGADRDGARGIGDARGTMVLSRHPASSLATADGTRFSNLSARIDLPGHPFTLVAAHPVNPGYGVEGWLDDSDAVARLALAHDEGPLVVAGDLNATAEHLTVRELMAKAGLSDTATGRGWHPTYPADTWFPPLIQIDRMLVSRQFRTVDFRTVRVAGTDHLGLLVTLTFS